MGLPFLLVDAGGVTIPVLAGYDDEGLIGFDGYGLELLRFTEADVRGLVNTDAAAVYWGAGLRVDAAPMRMAAETRREKTQPYSRPHAPPPAVVAHRLSPEYLAERFIRAHNGDANDPRVEVIANALRAIDVTRIGQILGSGSFGTAAALDERRVIKLTADPSEVQAGAVLIGKRLPHVALVYGSWFLSGVTVEIDIGEWLESRTGVLISQRLETFKEDDWELHAINDVVAKMKTKRKAWPHELAAMPAHEARELLYEVSEELEQELYKVDGDIAPDVAQGVAELREVGIYGIDVHTGNIGWDRDERVYKIFDVGSSSPPQTPRAPELKGPRLKSVPPAQLKLFGMLTPPVQVQELAGKDPEGRGEAREAAKPIVLSDAEVAALPVGSIVWPWASGRVDGSPLIVIPGASLTQVANLPERAGGQAPGGDPVVQWGNAFALVSKGQDRLPVHDTARRTATAWYENLLRPRATEAAKPVGRYAPRGYRFTPIQAPLFEGIVTGFPEVEPVLKRHRAETPSIDTIRYSTVFAMSTVRTSIAEAERSFDCFTMLYKPGQPFPLVDDIKACFRGLQNVKARRFAEAAEYAGVIQEAVGKGLKDGALRKHLATSTRLPEGLGLAKLSFTLALLGHDCICLDARILKRMFEEKRDEVEGGWTRKTKDGRLPDLSVKRYEAVEAAFLKGNPFYRPGDPIGKARAQWMSWESVGGKPAVHATWLRVVT